MGLFYGVEASDPTPLARVRWELIQVVVRAKDTVTCPVAQTCRVCGEVRVAI